MLKRLGLMGKMTNAAALVAPWQAGHAQFPDQSYEALFRDGYSKNEIVLACVEEWATDIAEAAIRAYKNTENGPEIIPDHPAITLLNNPNPWMSGDDFISAAQMYKRLAGNAFILKVRSQAGKVVELWLMRPDKVKVIPSVENYIDGYEYRNGTERVEIPAQDVIHLKTRHPFSDWYGWPPLMSAAGRTDIDNCIRDIVKGFIRNSGIPAGLLRLQGSYNDQEKALIRSHFRMDFGGENAGNVIVVNGPKDAADYTPLAMPLGARGLVIPELDEIDEARIAMVYRVPQSVLGTRLGMNSSSYGNRESDQKWFSQRQLVPEWQSIASVLTLGLNAEFPQLADYFGFDLSTVASLAPDMDAFSTRILAEVDHGVRSREEGRKALGLRPQPTAGDTFVVPVRATVMIAGANPGELNPAPGAQPPTEINDPHGSPASGAPPAEQLVPAKNGKVHV